MLLPYPYRYEIPLCAKAPQKAVRELLAHRLKPAGKHRIGVIASIGFAVGKLAVAQHDASQTKGRLQRCQGQHIAIVRAVLRWRRGHADR